MASFLSYTTSEGEEITVVPVLECGELMTNSIPSFSVLTVKLRRIKYQCNVNEAGKPAVKIVDGFIRDDPSLNRLYPAEVAVGSSHNSACLVEVSQGYDVARQARDMPSYVATSGHSLDVKEGLGCI